MIFTSTLLDNFYIGEEELNKLPSFQKGLPESIVFGNLIYGCKLIAECGIRLRLTQGSIVSAQILLWRFYTKGDMVEFNVKVHSVACLWLAQKIEEHQAKGLKDMVLAYYDTLYRKQGRKLTYEDTLSDGFQEWRTNVEKAELVILGKLGFCTLFDPPHKLVIAFLMWMDNGKGLLPSALFQSAWDLANLCTYTPVCLKFRSDVVACGVLYLAARQTNVPLAEDPPWWALLRVKRNEMLQVASDLLKWQKKDLASYEYTSPQKWLGQLNKKDDPTSPKIPPPKLPQPTVPIPPPQILKTPKLGNGSSSLPNSRSQKSSKEFSPGPGLRPPKGDGAGSKGERYSKDRQSFDKPRGGEKRAREGMGDGGRGEKRRYKDSSGGYGGYREGGYKDEYEGGRGGRDARKGRKEDGKRKVKEFKRKDKKYRD